MKITIALSAALCALLTAPAHAQLGGLSGRLKQAQDAKSKLDKVADLRAAAGLADAPPARSPAHA